MRRIASCVLAAAILGMTPGAANAEGAASVRKQGMLDAPFQANTAVQPDSDLDILTGDITEIMIRTVFVRARLVITFGFQG